MRTRGRISVVAAVACLTLAGCADPTFIGVQDYGTIYGNAVSATGAPISGALVSATGSTTVITTAANGSFSITKVAIGQQTLTIQAAGYGTATAQEVVTKDQPTNANNIVLTPSSGT